MIAIEKLMRCFDMDKRLSDSEKEIMEILWKNGSMTASEVFHAFADDGRKYTTVATFLTRLVKKGFLNCTKDGGQNLYAVAVGREDYLAEQTDEFVNEMYDGSAKDLIACLCKEKVSREDYGELMRLLNKYEDEIGVSEK